MRCLHLHDAAPRTQFLLFFRCCNDLPGSKKNIDRVRATTNSKIHESGVTLDFQCLIECLRGSANNDIPGMQARIKGPGESGGNTHVMHVDGNCRHGVYRVLRTDSGQQDCHFVRTDVRLEQVEFPSLLPVFKFVRDEGVTRACLREFCLDGEGDEDSHEPMYLRCRVEARRYTILTPQRRGGCVWPCPARRSRWLRTNGRRAPAPRKPD